METSITAFNTTRSGSGLENRKSRNNPCQLNRQESHIRASTAEMQRAWNRINMHRALAEEARSSSTTLDEILNPGYIATFTPTDLGDVAVYPQVLNDTAIEVRLPENHAPDNSSPRYPESGSEGSDFCIGLLSPWSTGSRASLESENSDFCFGLLSPQRQDQQSPSHSDLVGNVSVSNMQDERKSESVTHNAREQAARCLLEIPLTRTNAVPSREHLAAVTFLSADERIHLINQFLEQNAQRMDTFRARDESFEIVNPCTHKHQAIITDYSSAWDRKKELEFLTDAVLWIDALLLSFRTEIIEEDMTELKPLLEMLSVEISTRFLLEHAEKGKQKIHPDKSDRNKLYKCVTELSHSNSKRKDLLERTEIDIELFGDLLMSAESIKHRNFSEDELAGRDALLKGLQRIYSTIYCTAPFARVEDDKLVEERPTTNAEDGFEYFEPSHLPQYPIKAPPSSMNGKGTSRVRYLGFQDNTQSNPLGEGFWRAQDARKHTEEEQRTNKENGDETAVSGTFALTSPTTSDYSIPSNIDDQLEWANKQPSKKKGKFCMFVNKPGGCADKDNCTYQSHANEGKSCHKGNACTFGNNCAFVHDSSIRTDDNPLTRDLGPILKDVLADEKRYRPCRWVNKECGCKPRASGKPCTFNHTLKGFICEEYKRDECLRGHLCFLRHVNEYLPSVPPSTQAPAGPASSTSGASGFIKPQQVSHGAQPYNHNRMQSDMLGIGINLNAEQLGAPQSSTWVQSRSQTSHNNGPPTSALRGPRSQGVPAATMPGVNLEAMNGRGGEARNVKRKWGPFVEDDESDTGNDHRKQKKGGGWKGKDWR